MTIPEMIGAIDEAIRDSRVECSEKKERLQTLALQVWQIVYPGVSFSDEYPRLPVVGTEQTWSEVCKEIDRYETREQIYAVVDWPATGVDLTCIIK
jgi:hypothetical protein